MFVYGVLFILVHRALNTAGFGRKGMPVWAMAFAITIIYAVSDELHQTFVAGRYGSAKDVGYDALGAYVAILLKYKYI